MHADSSLKSIDNDFPCWNIASPIRLPVPSESIVDTHTTGSVSGSGNLPSSDTHSMSYVITRKCGFTETSAGNDFTLAYSTSYSSDVRAKSSHVGAADRSDDESGLDASVGFAADIHPNPTISVSIRNWCSVLRHVYGDTL